MCNFILRCHGHRVRGDFIFSIEISHCCKTSPLARMSNENYFHCNTSSLAFTIARLLGFSLQYIFVSLNDSNEKSFSLQIFFVGSIIQKPSIASFLRLGCIL